MPFKYPEHAEHFFDGLRKGQDCRKSDGHRSCFASKVLSGGGFALHAEQSGPGLDCAKT